MGFFSLRLILLWEEEGILFSLLHFPWGRREDKSDVLDGHERETLSFILVACRRVACYMYYIYIYMYFFIEFTRRGELDSWFQISRNLVQRIYFGRPS